MQYSICGFQQEEALKLCRVTDGHEVRVDATDLLILRWFVDFFPNMKKQVIDGTVYAWVNYQTLADEFPLLGMKKQAVAKRLKKLCDLEILEHVHITEGGSWSYFGFGKNYEKLVRKADTPIYENIDPSIPKDRGGVYESIDPLYTKVSSKDPSIKKDPSIINSEREDGEAVPERSLRFSPPSLEQIRNYARESGRPDHSEPFFDYYTSNGWKVGRNAMKDWRAAYRQWCAREKKKPQADTRKYAERPAKFDVPCPW